MPFQLIDSVVEGSRKLIDEIAAPADTIVLSVLEEVSHQIVGSDIAVTVHCTRCKVKIRSSELRIIVTVK